jgi:hypothetical protein
MTTTLATRTEANGRGGEIAVSSSVEAVRAAIDQLKALRTFVSEEMTRDVDFGVIPGTGTKPTLYLAGAQKIALYCQVTAEIDHERTELGGGHLEVLSTCRLKSRQTGTVLAMGAGSCSTMESKYRYRNAGRSCPECGSSAIITGKREYGGGFVCFGKKGGCGAKFAENDQRIVGQAVGRVENPDVYDQRNTVLKMAAKRSQVAAALNLGAMSEMFTQDIEDIYDVDHAPAAPAAEAAASPAKPDPAADRKREINRTFPAKEQPRAAEPAARVETFAEWLPKFARYAEDEWQKELAIEGVAKAERPQLCNVFALTNHLVTAAMDRDEPLIDPASVAKPGDPTKRDREKTKGAAQYLWATHRDWSQEELTTHVMFKRSELRRELNLPDPDGDDAVLDAAGGPELPREREPGED